MFIFSSLSCLSALFVYLFTRQYPNPVKMFSSNTSHYLDNPITVSWTNPVFPNTVGHKQYIKFSLNQEWTLYLSSKA